LEAVRILIVDDSKVVRDRLAEMLAAVPGVTAVDQATGPAVALVAFSRARPDWVVVDLRMPEGSGLSLLKAVKKLDPAIPVVVLTNFATPQYREECQAAGADYFFDKSTEFERVAELVTWSAARAGSLS
jgi:DNA-binding NarL/FixJ family response regulator